MRRAVLLVLSLCTSCGGGGQSSGAKYGEALSGAEILALFSDRTVVGHHEVHGYDFRSYYATDGTFRSHQSGKPEPRDAKWWVSGDDICVEWADTPGSLCRGIVVQAGVYRKVLDTGSGTKLIVTFESFTPGNPDNL